MQVQILPGPPPQKAAKPIGRPEILAGILLTLHADQRTDDQAEDVPVIEITLILASAYLATLATTFLPARSASRVAPAEALRYE